MAAARKKDKPVESHAEFKLGDVTVTLPVVPQGSLERTEAVVRQALHRLADFGSVVLHLPEPAEAEPEAAEPAE